VDPWLPEIETKSEEREKMYWELQQKSRGAQGHAWLMNVMGIREKRVIGTGEGRKEWSECVLENRE
jgi:hypothetical protein